MPIEPSFEACIPLLLTDKIASAASVQDVSEDIAIREIEAMSIFLLDFLLHREGQICVIRILLAMHGIADGTFTKDLHGLPLVSQLSKFSRRRYSIPAM